MKNRKLLHEYYVQQPVFVPNCLTDLGGLWYDEQETQAQECDVRWNFQKS